MNRRDAVLALAALGVLSTSAFAQRSGKIWRVGFLSSRSRPASPESDYFYGAFPRQMRELGYVEGKNLKIEWRFSGDDSARLATFAKELVDLKVDVILAAASQAAFAAKKATSSIPIVVGTSPDPVGSGLAASLARPGGNITGFSNLQSETILKCLELLIGVMPKLSRLALLTNPNNPATAAYPKVLQAAVKGSAIAILPFEARSPKEIDVAFKEMGRSRVEAIVVASDPMFIQQREQFGELVSKGRLPSVFAVREHVKAGGMMSYGSNLADNYRRAATYVDKIFKGASPADLPFEQPSTFELAVNLKTARLLGVSIPNSVLVRADEVIQ